MGNGKSIHGKSLPEKKLTVVICKSLSEAFIFASNNPKYDNRLFMKIVSSEYLQNMLCTQIDVFVLF